MKKHESEFLLLHGILNAFMIIPAALIATILGGLLITLFSLNKVDGIFFIHLAAASDYAAIFVWLYL